MPGRTTTLTTITLLGLVGTATLAACGVGGGDVASSPTASLDTGAVSPRSEGSGVVRPLRPQDLGATGSSEAPDGSEATQPRPAGSVTPLPPLAEPSGAEPCDGSRVRCVDASRSAEGSDGTAEHPYPSIPSALEGAGPETVVQVAAAEYRQPLTIADVAGLRLVGGFTSGGDFSARDAVANVTTIVGRADAPVIDVTASSGVRIEGFRITGGGGHSDGSNRFGGGIHVDSESTEIDIVGNRIDGNAIDQDDDPSSSRGGAIKSDADVIRIVGNVIEDNRAGRGAGIAAEGKVTVHGNTVRNNTAVGDHGGGIYLAGDVEVIGNCPDAEHGGDAVLAGISEEDDEIPQVHVRNSILWGNGDRAVVSIGADITVDYSLSEQRLDGEGNRTGDPQFRDPANGDYGPGPGSPARDAGDPDAPVGAEPAPGNTRIDLGHTGGTEAA